MIKKFCLILIMTVLLFYCKGDTDNNGENGENGNGNNGNGSNTRTEAIIVDHNHTDIAKISDQWIEDVKKNFVVHYAHTSHGGQIVVGLQRLSGQSSRQLSSDQDRTYTFYHSHCQIPGANNGLRMMDGQYTDYCETYIGPELYWQGEDALNITRTVLNNFDVNISLWSWCCQLDHYSQSETKAYLDSMSKLENEYPDITFIYMTGNAQSEEQNRFDRNNQIRDYCGNNNKVLFDFADLDCWYNGVQHTVNGIPIQHPRYNGDQAGHTTYESCENKGKAFWWLLARLAGWEGE